MPVARLALLAGCPSQTNPSQPDGTTAAGRGDGASTSTAATATASASTAARKPVVRKVGCPRPLPTEAMSFDHRRSKLVTKLGGARHGSADVVVNPGDEVVLGGKFSYGKASKDLEDEAVVAFVEVERCRWRRVAKGVTDDDGEVSLKLPAKLRLKPGVYRFDLVLVGDRTRSSGWIWVVAKSTEAVVFDIDGTLTTGDDQMVKQLLAGKSPVMRAGAVEAVAAHAKKGRQPVFITGRPRFLAGITRKWLARHRFAKGPLLLTTSLSEAKPSESGVQAFKKTQLQRLKSKVGLRLLAAYGNATTDICAYAQAGIDPKATFILGKHGGKSCKGFGPTQKLGRDYRKHEPR